MNDKLTEKQPLTLLGERRGSPIISKRERGYACIGLDNPKNTINIGSVLRACGCYSAAMLALSGVRGVKHIGRIPSDTMKAYRHIPLLMVEDLKNVIPYDCVPIAVDLINGARSLPEYTHPERAFYIFGAEDETLDENVLSWCRDVIYIPTNRCMNLAATVNVVLYDRLAKLANDKRDARRTNETI